MPRLLEGRRLLEGGASFNIDTRRLFEDRLLLEEMLYIYLGQPLVKSHDGPGVTRSIINELNSWYIQEGQKEAEALMDNIFMLVFLHILQKLSIFPTDLFVHGILSIRKVQWITTFVKIPVFPG